MGTVTEKLLFYRVIFKGGMEEEEKQEQEKEEKNEQELRVRE